jgi:bifunctional non-homologous end joining protein LigD
MLKEYAEKRRLEKTPEPPPERRRGTRGALQFVVHKHAARRLHYDLRLELDGALKSWAVPKGPSLNPDDKHLAVMVEDHPIDYGGFEGVIPAGEYGAGEVIIWDRGSYAPEEDGHRTFERAEGEERMRRGLAEGKLSFFLDGDKLRGSWTLVKSKRGENDWLLIKHRDETPQRDILAEDRSVVSGMTVEDLKVGGKQTGTGRSSVRRNGHPQSPADLPKARKAPFPRTPAPMLATLAREPFSHPDWVFEPKLDGLRAITLIDHGKPRLISRGGRDVTRGYPSLAGELTEQREQEMVLDGEIVAPDEKGRPSFQHLQQRMNLQGEADIRRADVQVPVLYYVFDILYLHGYDLRAVPFEERRRQLEHALLPSQRVRLIDQFEEAGEAAYEAAVEHGLEGVMAKRRDSVYRSGERSRLWLKIKATLSDEFVIGGYSRGTGARGSTFGALILGQYTDEGELRYAGHVGTGFDELTLDALLQRLQKLQTDRSPFAGEVSGRTEATWVRPELVAEVKFAERTGDGRLRAPVFMRLREDKPAKEAERVEVVAGPSSRRKARKNKKAGEDPPANSPVKKKDVDDVLEQLSDAKGELALTVEGHRLDLSNLDKALWPAAGNRRALTKMDLLVYLAKVSPYLLPHLKDRPLTLKRYPDGIEGESFFQKHWADPLPPFVEKVLLYSDHTEGDQEYLLCNNLPTLLWLGQIADIELHTWYSRVDPEPDGEGLTTRFSGSLKDIKGSALNYPDFIVFDLDPYLYSGEEKEGAEPALNKAAFAKTREVANRLREVLDSLSLSAFVKTSGMTGLHIYVPILRRVDFDAVRAAAGTVGRFLMQEYSDDITMEWAVRKRKGKIFFDHNQNSRGKTLASAYSPRPSPEASVSMPLSWEELDKVYPTDFTILNVPERLAKKRDPWKGILDAKHDLGSLLKEAFDIEAATEKPARRRASR